MGSALDALEGRVEELSDGPTQHLLKHGAIPAIHAGLAIVMELNRGMVERDDEIIDEQDLNNSVAKLAAALATAQSGGE